MQGGQQYFCEVMYFISRRGTREKVKGFTVEVSATPNVHETFFKIAVIDVSIRNQDNYESGLVVGGSD